jgi:hypothetical protein
MVKAAVEVPINPVLAGAFGQQVMGYDAKWCVRPEWPEVLTLLEYLRSGVLGIRPNCSVNMVRG